MPKLLKLLADNRHRTLRQKGQPIIVQGEGDASNEATIYLYDAIMSDRLSAEYWGGVCAQDLVPQIAAIQADVIHVRINSPGGDVFAAQAICAALKQHKGQVIAHIDGLAASAATAVACACNEVEIADGAMYMIHNAWTFAMGDKADLQKTVAVLEKVDLSLAGQYQAFSGGDLAQITSWMDAETWFTAAEAVEHGFATRAATAKASASASNSPAASAWDLSAYARAPQAVYAPPAQPAPPSVSAAPPNPAPQATTPAACISADHRARQHQRLSKAQRT